MSILFGQIGGNETLPIRVAIIIYVCFRRGLLPECLVCETIHENTGAACVNSCGQGEEKVARTRSYREYLLKRLQDPEEAVAYLNAALEDEDPRVFLLALRNVADALGGMSLLAKETHLSRGTLYRTLSTEGNPRFSSLMSVLEAVGMTISIDMLDNRKTA